MKGFQKSFLRGIGQTLRPSVHVGKNGLDEGFLREVHRVFDQQELVKIKFAAHKEDKKTLSQKLAEELGAEIVGMIGHNVLLYREHPEPEKRQIRLPTRREETDFPPETPQNDDS